MSTSVRPRPRAGPRALPAQESARLYDKYQAQVYRYCRARLFTDVDAEDALQNVFLRVHTALRQGVVPEFEATWLYTIAHNVCLSRQLSAARRAKLESAHDPVFLAEHSPAHNPESEELIGLRDALAELPPQFRRVLLLREWQGMSYKEIADKLGTSLTAVETQIFRARRRLAENLEGRRAAAATIGWVLNVKWFLDAVKRLVAGNAAAGALAGAVVTTGGAVALTLPPGPALSAAVVVRQSPKALTQPQLSRPLGQAYTAFRVVAPSPGARAPQGRTHGVLVSPVSPHASGAPPNVTGQTPSSGHLLERLSACPRSTLIVRTARGSTSNVNRKRGAGERSASTRGPHGTRGALPPARTSDCRASVTAAGPAPASRTGSGSRIARAHTARTRSGLTPKATLKNGALTRQADARPSTAPRPGPPLIVLRATALPPVTPVAPGTKRPG